MLGIIRCAVSILLLRGISCLVNLSNQKPGTSSSGRIPQSHQHISHVNGPLADENELYLPNALSSGNVGEEVVFQLLNGQLCRGQIEQISRHGEEAFVWSGTTQSGGIFHVSCSNGAIIGEISFPEVGIKYQLRPKDLTSNLYTVKAVPKEIYDRDDSPENTDPTLQIEGAAALRRRAQFQRQQYTTPRTQTDGDGAPIDTEPGGTPPDNSDTGPVVDTNNILDVMFIFTPQAAASVGGTQSSMEALAALSVQLANDAYANTNLPIRMRSVNVATLADTTYREEGFTIELDRLHTDKDGHFDDEVNLRTTVGADAVVLFTSDISYCGLAYLWATADMALSVVSSQCPASVVHEVGHNIGCDHDRFTVHDYDYTHSNFGYCWDTSAKTCSRSVMAYAGCVTTGKRTNCPRAPYFSSPLIIQGPLHRPTGLATSDNARIIREQLSRAISWRRSTILGGMITSAQPSTVPVGRCQPVVIKGFRIGTADSTITSVTLNGVPVQKILSQSLDEVEVLVGLSDVLGTGDIVVTTSSGYQTTLTGAFTYEATSGSFLTDFDSSLGTTWTSTGATEWSVLRYCDSLPCSNAPVTGPIVGAGGSGNFLKVQAFEASDDVASLTATFNQDVSGGCEEAVTSLSLVYHMWGPHNDLCRGSLTVSMLTTGATAWTTILTATSIQAHQDDPWLPLQYDFPHSTAVTALRITAHPYSGQSTCFYWGSVSVDQISITKTTTCSKDNCDYVSAYPTIALTHAPSKQPVSRSPTTAHPTALPSIAVIPTPPPTALVPVLETVRFDCTQTLTGVTVQQFLAQSTNTAAFLLVAASMLKLSPEDVCCATMVDVGHNLKGLSTGGIRISYKVELHVLYQLGVVGPKNASAINRSEGRMISPTATEAFESVKQLLTNSVSSGSYLQALKRSLSSDVASAGIGVDAVTTKTFSTPVSSLVVMPDEPTSADPPAWTARLSLIIGLSILLITLGGGGCFIWARSHKASAVDKAKALAAAEAKFAQDEASASNYGVLRTVSSDDCNRDCAGFELTPRGPSIALNDESSSCEEGDTRVTPRATLRAPPPTPAQTPSHTPNELRPPLHGDARSRNGSWAIPSLPLPLPSPSLRGYFSPRVAPNIYRAMSGENADLYVPSADEYVAETQSLDRAPGQLAPGIIPRMQKTLSGNGLAIPQLSVHIGDVSAPYRVPVAGRSPHSQRASPTSRARSGSPLLFTPGTSTSSMATGLQGYSRSFSGSLDTQTQGVVQELGRTPRVYENSQLQQQAMHMQMMRQQMQRPGYPHKLQSRESMSSMSRDPSRDSRESQYRMTESPMHAAGRPPPAYSPSYDAWLAQSYDAWQAQFAYPPAEGFAPPPPGRVERAGPVRTPSMYDTVNRSASVAASPGFPGMPPLDMRSTKRQSGVKSENNSRPGSNASTPTSRSLGAGSAVSVPLAGEKNG